MTLLAPLALLFAPLLAIVAALYLLKPRRPSQVVPCLDMWLALAGPARPRTLFRSLKRWLSLLLWLVIVAAAILAVANPVLTLGGVRPASIVLIIDNSASMQTIEDPEQGTTRLDLARSAVDRMVSQRPVPDEWLIIEAGAATNVICSWTRDARAIRKATASIAPSLAAANLEESAALARQLFEDKDDPVVVVVTDGDGGEAARLAESAPELIIWPVGRVTDNVGITNLRTRVHRQQATQHVLVEVHNASASPIDTTVVFELDGSAIAVEPCTAAPGERWERTLVLDQPGGGVLRASIDRPDAFQPDNEAFAVLPPIRPSRVLLVSTPDDAFFFQHALAAMEPLVDMGTSVSATLAQYQQMTPEERAADLVIFNNIAPQTLPPTGRFVFINGLPPIEGLRDIGAIESPELAAVSGHPLLRHVSFRGAGVRSARRVDVALPATTLIESRMGDPLGLLVREPGRDILCLTFDVLETDLPFRNAFPMLLRNAVVHFAQDDVRWVGDQHRTGTRIEPSRLLPPDVTTIGIARPGADGAIGEVTIPVRHNSFIFDDTGRPGPVRFTIGDAADYAAINMNDPEETDLAPTPFPDPADRLVLSGRILGTVPWVVLVAASLVLAALEWTTYHMRWTE